LLLHSSCVNLMLNFNEKLRHSKLQKISFKTDYKCIKSSVVHHFSLSLKNNSFECDIIIFLIKNIRISKLQLALN
jgi:hypothetical protein